MAMVLKLGVAFYPFNGTQNSFKVSSNFENEENSAFMSSKKPKIKVLARYFHIQRVTRFLEDQKIFQV